jgi:hypothetical protein
MTTCLMDEATATAAALSNEIMIACDDVYCDPFDLAARVRVQALLVTVGDGSPGRRVRAQAAPPACAARTSTRHPSHTRGDGKAELARYQSSRGATVATRTRSDNTSARQAKGEHTMSPSALNHLSSADDDRALVREFSRELKIACDELHDDPFDVAAREALKTLIAEHGPAADAALDRLSAEPSSSSSCRTR